MKRYPKVSKNYHRISKKQHINIYETILNIYIYENIVKYHKISKNMIKYYKMSCCINLMVVKPGALQDIAGLFEQC